MSDVHADVWVDGPKIVDKVFLFIILYIVQEIDPTKNYVTSFKKEGVGKIIAKYDFIKVFILIEQKSKLLGTLS